MSLIELIKQHASEAATAGDYALVASVLNANDVDVVDDTYYTSRYLVTLLGVDTYRIVSGSLAAIGEVDPLVKDIHQTLKLGRLGFAPCGSCDQFAKLMDMWGDTGCSERFDRICKKLEREALRRWLPPVGIRSLVDSVLRSSRD